MKPIKVVIPRSSGTTGVIRLTREAEDVIRKIQCQCGLPMSSIVSQIILQAADLVEVVREESV